VLGAVGASLEEQLGDTGVVPFHGVDERREAGELAVVAGLRGEVDVCATGQEGDDQLLGEAVVAGVA
jgi:hypothetical protein